MGGAPVGQPRVRAGPRATLVGGRAAPAPAAWFRPEEIDWDAAPIQAVLAAMPEGTHLHAAVGFLLTPQPDLELQGGRACRPVDWLRDGRDLGLVLDLATGVGGMT